MNQTRWDSPYATNVRDALVTMVQSQAVSEQRSRAGETGRSPVAPPTHPHHTGFAWRPVAITVVVGAAVVAASLAAIEFAQTRAPHSLPAGSAPPTTRAELRSALLQRLPAGAPDEPAITWTDTSPGATGGPMDLTGTTPILVAACAGGGSIDIELTGRPSIKVDCSNLTAIGPITIIRPVGVAVSSASGHPRYLVKVVAQKQ